MANSDINININGKYKGRGAFKQAGDDVDGLSNKVKKTTKEWEDYDRKSTKAAKSTNALGSNANTLNGKLKGLGGGLGVFNKGLGSSVSKLGMASGAVAGLTGMLGGTVGILAIVGAAMAAFGVTSYNAAKTSQAEWAKFKGVAQSAGQDFENSKKVVTDYASTSGRAVKDVRTAFQQLTAAGINPSQEALRAVNELAIGTKGNMADAAVAYTRITKGGAGAGRTLAKLGLTMEDISTGGKVDTAKLNRVLEEKFGKAADNYAKTAEAAQTRLQDTFTRFQVRFGNLLLGPSIALMDGLSFALEALMNFGSIVWGLFGGADAFKYAMEYLTPAIDELWKAIQDLIGPITGVGDQSSSLQFILTAFGWGLAQGIKILAWLVRSIKWNIDTAIKFGQAVWLAGDYLLKMGKKLWAAGVQAYSAIVNAPSTLRSYMVSAGQKIWQAAANFPGWLWNAVVSALPKIQWPSPRSIYDMIKNALGFGGPPSGLYASTVGRWKANLTAEGLAAQKAQTISNYQSSPAAQNAANTATSNMGIFGTGFNLFGGPMDGLSVNYQAYRGSKQNPWSGENCLTGNCVDMSRGILQYAAAGGAKSLGYGIGTWDGSPHVWAMVDGKAYDPARKALDGTWSPPAAGPGDSGSPIIIDLKGATIYDGPKFEQAVSNLLNKYLG